jgi:hypothetical protein
MKTPTKTQLHNLAECAKTFIYEGDNEELFISVIGIQEIIAIWEVIKTESEPTPQEQQQILCNCQCVETTDIRKSEGIYFHELCGKPITSEPIKTEQPESTPSAEELWTDENTFEYRSNSIIFPDTGIRIMMKHQFIETLNKLYNSREIDLKALYTELESDAYNVDTCMYEVKQTNQIIRKYFEKQTKS